MVGPCGQENCCIKVVGGWKVSFRNDLMGAGLAVLFKFRYHYIEAHYNCKEIPTVKEICM